MLLPTRPSINWLRLPIWVPIVLQFWLLQRLYGLRLVNECVPRVVIAHKVGDDAPYRIWPFSVMGISFNLGLSFWRGVRTCLRYRRIGSATLNKSTPGGSTIRRHLMVATYCCKINRVSAPGWRSRFAFLIYQLNLVGKDLTRNHTRFTQRADKVGALIDSLQAISKIL